MKELSLYVLDIVKNSVAAGATHIGIQLQDWEGQTPEGRRDETYTITITDNGRGMDPEFLARVTDPFTTTRTTRKVGMGLALFRLAAEQTGGSLEIESAPGKGTRVTAVFHTNHVDCPPEGFMSETFALLIQGSPQVEFSISHHSGEGGYDFTTEEVRAILGEDISLDEPEVFQWLNDYLFELESQP